MSSVNNVNVIASACTMAVYASVMAVYASVHYNIQVL